MEALGSVEEIAVDGTTAATTTGITGLGDDTGAGTTTPAGIFGTSMCSGCLGRGWNVEERWAWLLAIIYVPDGWLLICYSFGLWPAERDDMTPKIRERSGEYGPFRRRAGFDDLFKIF